MEDNEYRIVEDEVRTKSENVKCEKNDDDEYRIIGDPMPPLNRPQDSKVWGRHIRIGLSEDGRFYINFNDDKYTMDVDGAKELATGMLEIIEINERKTVDGKRKRYVSKKLS